MFLVLQGIFQCSTVELWTCYVEYDWNIMFARVISTSTMFSSLSGPAGSGWSEWTAGLQTIRTDTRHSGPCASPFEQLWCGTDHSWGYSLWSKHVLFLTWSKRSECALRAIKVFSLGAASESLKSCCVVVIVLFIHQQQTYEKWSWTQAVS